MLDRAVELGLGVLLVVVVLFAVFVSYSILLVLIGVCALLYSVAWVSSLFSKNEVIGEKKRRDR